MNFKELAEYSGLEEGEFLELVELFLESTASDLAKLEGALSAGSIQETVEAAHSIKGAAGSLGFMDAHECAKRIETNARQQSLEGGLEDAGSIRKILGVIAEAVSERQSA